MSVEAALKKLPYGSVVKYRKKVYFKSQGVCADILTDQDGHWNFISDHTEMPERGKELRTWTGIASRWKSFKVVYRPKA